MKSEKLSFGNFKDLLFETANRPIRTYEPSGVQEEIIYSVGCGKFEIILALHANDEGKTTTGINILKNIIWPVDEKWFAYWEGFSLFKDKKWPLKQFRITGTHEALSDTGAIQTEIAKWWPVGEYELDKKGKHYYSQCTCKNGWAGDFLTYNQSRTEYESKKIDVCLSDEPPKPDLVGAITSRFTDGLLWIITATPIKCGIFLDYIDDLAEKGVKVKKLTASAFDNSITKGKPNHLGTKRGLRSDEEIASKVARCPLDEQDARIHGIASNKSGKIYHMYSERNVKDIDLTSGYLAKCNCYMGIDPHPKYYPFLKWYAITPDSKVIVYNEWPTYEGMGKRYYNEIRNEKEFKLSYEQFAAVIKACDLTEFGAKILNRIPDPRFVHENVEFITKLAEYGVTNWKVPPFEKIETQRIVLQELMRYDPQIPFNQFNCPQWYHCSWCKNTGRSYERHYWDEENEVEAEEYKDGIDPDRYFLSVIPVKYRDFKGEAEAKKSKRITQTADKFSGSLVNTSMVN